MQQDTRLTQKKSAAFLYTDDKWGEKEIRETSPFTIATNNKLSWNNSKLTSGRPI